MVLVKVLGEGGFGKVGIFEWNNKWNSKKKQYTVGPLLIEVGRLIEVSNTAV